MRRPYVSRWIALLSIGLLVAGCAGAAAPATPSALTEMFTSSDGTITLRYPAGWVASDAPGLVTIANVQAAIDAVVPAPGQFQTRLFTTPITAIQGMQADATPRDVLQFFAETLSTTGVTFNPATDVTVGTRTAARIDGAGSDGQAVVLAINLGEGNYAFATATSAPGELGRFEPTLLAMLESLAYAPLVAPTPEVTP